MNEKIKQAVEAAEVKHREAAEVAELERLADEARRTFPDGWKLRLFDTPAGVSVSIEFIVATAETAPAALRAAIDDYNAAKAADPENAERVTVPKSRIVGLDGKPIS